MSIPKVFLRTMYNYDTDSVSNETALSEFGPTLTVQSEAENCDINVILERFGQGIPPPINTLPPSETEWDSSSSFQSAMNLIVQSREAFMEIPANIRARFHNDPAEYLEFVYNDANRDEAILLGLIPKPESPVDSSAGDSGSTSASASVPTA